MKVLRLIMTSFGNQQNKIIDFSDQVNLIMGSDKGTLQTVRTFLEGMLFGLSADDQKRYRPGRNAFSGVMVVEDDTGKQIKVERDFNTNQFTVTDRDGIDVTDNYADEYGEFSVLPVSDSIFASDAFSLPDSANRERKRLSELKAKRRSLISRYDYEGMLKQRDELVQRLDEQKQREEEIEANSSLISENDLRIQNINKENNQQIQEIDHKISGLKNSIINTNLEIEQLKAEASSRGTGKKQVLQRTVQGVDEQIERIDKRIFELKNQEKSYTQKLEKLQSQFTLDKDELRRDYENFQTDIQAESGIVPEPLVDKMSRIKNILYVIAIVIGLAGIGLALYNPGDTLSRILIYLISFVCVFLVLISIFGLYLKRLVKEKKPSKLTLPVERIRAKEIMNKYHQESPEEFNEFYQDAKKIFVHIDNLKADIKDIKKEIGESEADKQRLLEAQKETKIDLAKNRDQYKDNTIQDRIIELTRNRKALEAQVEDLTEERTMIEQESIRRIKEESFHLLESNHRLQNDSDVNNKVIDDFYQLQKKIDRYESKMIEIDKEIKEVEESLMKQRHQFVLNYANPEEEDFAEKMARQFNFGLQKNIRQGGDVPYITYNPFVNAGGDDEILIEKLKKFINNKQVLVFSTELDEEEIFKNNIKHNGIYIAANRKVG